MAPGAAIDAYAEAQLLTGQAASPSVEELTRRALKIKQERSRLFVFWECGEAECHAVGPHTRCSCGHSYSSHAWFETSTKKVRCRVDGCRCSCFGYVPGQGSSKIRCGCKHSHEDHRRADGTLGPCTKCTDCKGFHSDWRCGTCGQTYDEHRVTFMTAAERAAAGRSVEENLGGWSQEKPHLDAVCGGVTRMTSLLSGGERVGIPLLQHTDGAAGSSSSSAAAAVCQPCAPSSTAEMFSNYDRRADSHVARLRQLRDANAPADRGQGRRLGGGELATAVVQAPAPAPAPAPRPPRPASAGRGGAGRGGRGALARGRGAGAGGLAAARGAGTTAGALVPSGRALSAQERREAAAAAAEARLNTITEAPAPPPQQPPPVVPAAPAAAVAPRPPAQPRAARPSGGPSATGTATQQHNKPNPRAARPAGAAKAATLAVKRERAAAAAEARMGGAHEQEVA